MLYYTCYIKLYDFLSWLIPGYIHSSAVINTSAGPKIAPSNLQRTYIEDSQRNMDRGRLGAQSNPDSDASIYKCNMNACFLYFADKLHILFEAVQRSYVLKYPYQIRLYKTQ